MFLAIVRLFHGMGLDEQLALTFMSDDGFTYKLERVRNHIEKLSEPPVYEIHRRRFGPDEPFDPDKPWDRCTMADMKIGGILSVEIHDWLGVVVPKNWPNYKWGWIKLDDDENARIKLEYQPPP